MRDDYHTISMASSEYTWDDVDKRIKETGSRNRSQYIQNLIENDLNPKKRVKIIEVVILLILAIIVLEILIVV